MEITTEQLHHCDHLIIKGRIDASTAKEFGDTLKAVTDAGRYKIAINLKDVTFMSSAGLGELIEAQKKCKQLARGKVVLAEASDRIKEVLKIAGLDTLFELYDTATAAVDSF